MIQLANEPETMQSMLKWLRIMNVSWAETPCAERLVTTNKNNQTRDVFCQETIQPSSTSLDQPPSWLAATTTL